MAVSLPNGAVVSIEASAGVAKSITELDNTSPSVATFEASHGIIVGDIFRLTSGWSRATDRLFRASVVATNDVTVEGLNAASTSIYPAGSGVPATGKEILTWTQLSQILESTSQGGEQQFTEYQFLEADTQVRIPTVKSASGMSLRVADDPSLAGYQLCETANDDRQPRGVRIEFSGGSKLYFLSYITLNKIPRMTVNEVMSVEVTMSLLNEPTRYAS